MKKETTERLAAVIAVLASIGSETCKKNRKAQNIKGIETENLDLWVMVETGKYLNVRVAGAFYGVSGPFEAPVRDKGDREAYVLELKKL